MDFIERQKSLPPALQARWGALVKRVRELGPVIVAFSGGVDSGLLSAAAWYALDKRMLAVIIRSPVESVGDFDSARKLATETGFPMRVDEIDDLNNAEFTANPPNRCYVCKLVRLGIIKNIAEKEGYRTVIEGSNVADLRDYRPGFQAVIETRTISPFIELEFGKQEIRHLAKELGLSVWDRPSAPCLATRFPYGSPITANGLRQVVQGEQYLSSLGFHSVRVRHYGQVASLEVAPEEIENLVSSCQTVSDFFRSLGFHRVSVDQKGYRKGSLNEELI